MWMIGGTRAVARGWHLCCLTSADCAFASYKVDKECQPCQMTACSGFVLTCLFSSFLYSSYPKPFLFESLATSTANRSLIRCISGLTISLIRCILRRAHIVAGSVKTVRTPRVRRTIVPVYVGNGWVRRSSERDVRDGSDGSVTSDGMNEAWRRCGICRGVRRRMPCELRTTGRHNMMLYDIQVELYETVSSRNTIISLTPRKLKRACPLPPRPDQGRTISCMHPVI
jgi:hypothetical protein